MSVDLVKLDALIQELKPFNASLVAVSKTKPVGDIAVVHNHGQLDFGENYVQELLSKSESLPSNIRWHFIGHLQSNKIKMILPLVTLIHGVDSLSLLEAISKEAIKAGKQTDVLLQVHIADENTKFGFSPDEVKQLYDYYLKKSFQMVAVRGLMGMGTLTDDEQKVRMEFRGLKKLFDACSVMQNNSGPSFNILSMGMTSDYKIALDEGSNMVRIGSAIFGER